MIFESTEINKPRGSPKYVTQQDDHSCGPVAVINYWKYCGLNVSYRDLKILSRILRTGPWGTYNDRMSSIFGVKWKRKRSEPVPPFIVRSDNHFWFCPCEIKGGFLAINYSDHIVYHKITKSMMINIIGVSEVLELEPSRR
jgi:hypothetical protein